MQRNLNNAFAPRPSTQALIVNFGGGVDSSAIIVELAALYLAGDDTARPDLVVFADTGDELPEVYENVRRIARFVEETFDLELVIVSRPNNIPGRVGYKSLSENCITNETLPSEAFGRGACSSKWKYEAIDAFLYGRKRPLRAGWLELNGFTDKAIKCIGYDATETVSGKRAKNAKIAEDAQSFYRYPLVEWGYSRELCKDAIARAGLPIPQKSACFMCPNQTPEELVVMSTKHRGLFLRALAIEEIARRGKHGLRIEGMWRRTRKIDNRPGSWVEWALREELVTMPEIEALILVLKPHLAQKRLPAATR